MNKVLTNTELERGLAHALRLAGHKVYVVGGAVRDLFLNIEPHDVDLTTSMPAVEMHTLGFTTEVFEAAGVIPTEIKFIPLGVEFGVGAFSMNDDASEPPKRGEVVEVANFRLDLNFTGHHRGVTVGVAETVEEDLMRRDFSMNAMALDPFEEDLDKALVDPFNGYESLMKGVITTPAEPSLSFEQDPLRVLRAVRFATRFGFLLDTNLITAAQSRTVRQRFRLLSQERIRDELLKILDVPDGHSVATAFTLLQETRVLELFLPELSALANLPYVKKYHTEDPFGHTVLALSHTPADIVTRLAVLFHDLGKRWTIDPTTFATPGHAGVSANLAEAVMRRLKMPMIYLDQVKQLVSSHMDDLSEGRTSRKLKRSGLYQYGREHLDRGYQVRVADKMGRGRQDRNELKALEKTFEKLSEWAETKPLRSVKDLPVSGKDVLRLTGVKPGPVVGKILSYLFEQVVDEKLPEDRECLLTAIQVEHEKMWLPFN